MTGSRISTQTLELLRGRLSDRDTVMLRSLDEHRFLTTSQLARLHFARTEEGRVAVRACVRVLARLHELQLVDRLERQVGGVRAGSAAFVWTLTTTGDRLLRLGSSKQYARTRHVPSLDHLAHVLAIAEVHLLLVELSRAGDVELLGVELEPTCWRRYVGPDGVAQVLKPDLSAVTATLDFEDHWLVEVDRGREGLGRLIAQSARYTAYARTGREQRARGVFPYVLWLLPSVERARRLEAEVARAPGVDPSLLRFATPATLRAVLTGDARAGAATTDDALARLLAGGAHERF